uniref:Uncharacterized protein n=1 Tax=Caenorhabditis japonica TaxID=281687 RepID=A0A8R1ICK2_CAEJA
MNSSQRRSIMFGDRLVVEMDIDPYASNIDTPEDLKVSSTHNRTESSSPKSSAAVKFKKHKKPAQRSEEKKENEASEIEEPSVKNKC